MIHVKNKSKEKKQNQPSILSKVYMRQAIAPPYAAVLHRSTRLHESRAILTANNTTLRLTDFFRPEQPSSNSAFGSKYYGKIIWYSKQNDN
jgi:hypothetical protein